MADSLPEGWRLIRRSGRPVYRRPDGYKVALDAPGRWGIREPGNERPFRTFEDKVYAMRWCDEQYPAMA